MLKLLLFYNKIVVKNNKKKLIKFKYIKNIKNKNNFKKLN